MSEQWKLIWILTRDESKWIARDGVVSDPSYARLFAGSQQLLEAAVRAADAIHHAAHGVEVTDGEAIYLQLMEAIQIATGDAHQHPEVSS